MDCIVLQLSLSLSLSHTHTHTHNGRIGVAWIDKYRWVEAERSEVMKAATIDRAAGYTYIEAEERASHPINGLLSVDHH
jgi:hypothetical protein